MLYRAPSLSFHRVPLAVRLIWAGGSPCGWARRSVTGPWPAVTP